MINSKVNIFHGKDAIKQFSKFLYGEEPQIPLVDGRRAGFLIKPNLLRNECSSTGITTDVNVVMALIEYLDDRGFKDIIVGDGSEAQSNTEETLTDQDYYDIPTLYPNVKVVNLNKGPLVPIKLCGTQLFINKYLLDYQVISVGKLKPHGMFKLTMTIKNLMGGVIPKGNMHGNFENKIQELYKMVAPVYGIVDGLIANGRCENIPCPIKMNTILCGSLLPYVDKVGGMILGREAGYINSLFKAVETADSYVDKEMVTKLAKLYREGGLK